MVARIASFGWFPAAGSVRNASQDLFRVHCPVPGPSRSDPPGVLPGKVDKICGGHGQGETPGPIPNPEAKALHGDGTAPERVWESSAPPLHTIRFPPVEPLRAPGGFLVFSPPRPPRAPRYGTRASLPPLPFHSSSSTRIPPFVSVRASIRSFPSLLPSLPVFVRIRWTASRSPDRGIRIR